MESISIGTKQMNPNRLRVTLTAVASNSMCVWPSYGWVTDKTSGIKK